MKAERLVYIIHDFSYVIQFSIVVIMIILILVEGYF
jgi:hypothetical protein